ncbi:MAG: hypothetical protein ACYDER_07900 [Ktedonobacteraceae bacterium]
MRNTVPPVAASTEPPAPPVSGEIETLGRLNKYLYEEFAGYEGERRLKSILHKILPMALYRTWEVLVERQAPGNDCFLSIASISETAERVERTIRLNIHEFEARKLLVLRPEQKLLRQPDQSLKLKLVIVKDFSGLYALAHEYLLWTQSDCYIEPERDFAEAIRSQDALKRKLIRFNNYRRIMENKVPGPKPVEREEHRWYTEYIPESDSQELGTAGGTATPSHEAIRAGSAEEDKSPTMGNLSLQEDLKKDLKKDSEERITPSNHKDTLYRDLFGSENASEGRGCGYTKNPNEQTHDEQGQRDAYSPTTQTNPTNPSLVASELAGAKQADGKEQADLDERAQAFVERAMATYQGCVGKTAGRGNQRTEVLVKPNRLVSAFVREISSLFCDRNVQGSLTRVLRAVENTSLSQKDMLACLVKAYLIAFATKTVQPQHQHPDGDNKMPLFCSMFVKFVNGLITGTFQYTDEHLVRDIIEDERLKLFVTEYHLEDTVLNASVGDEGQGEKVEDQSAPEEETSSNLDAVQGTSLEQSPVPEQVIQAEAEEPQQNWIPIVDPEDGWPTWSSADHWADLLREHYPYGINDYHYDVLPVCYDSEPTGKWAFVFYTHREEQHHWALYVNSDQVKRHLLSAEKVWVAYDGVVGWNGEAD